MKGLGKLSACIYPIEAYIVRSLLASSGIRVVLFDEYFVLMNNFRSIAVGGIKIYVEEDSYELAKDILSEYTQQTSYKRDYRRIYKMSLFFSIYNLLVITGLIVRGIVHLFQLLI